MDREEMEKMRALMQDFMTPTVRWVIVGGDGDLVVFTDADGRTTRYAANDKKEKHQLLAGTIETKTKWLGGELHQEVVLRDGVKATRTFAVEEDQLVVTTTFDGAGPGGRRPPVLWVYDRDVEQ